MWEEKHQTVNANENLPVRGGTCPPRGSRARHDGLGCTKVPGGSRVLLISTSNLVLRQVLLHTVSCW